MVSRQSRSRAVNSAGGFMRDFKEFIMRGNVVDLAVAVVIGAAFAAIIGSFVDDILTPLILQPALAAVGADDIAALSINGIQYGLFLAAVINFIVIAFCMFLVVRAFEKLKRKEEVEEAAAEPTPEEKLTATLERLNATLEQKM
ncbi:MAG: large conductance mechanosensitive channel protein MscL [Leptolyngbya sp. SIO4C1]|nr:large conductance mechanosensitive channel protein MscL [Leptolyngbya sp. SIO4C1]